VRLRIEKKRYAAGDGVVVHVAGAQRGEVDLQLLVGRAFHHDSAEVFGEIHIVGEGISVLRPEGVGVLTELRSDGHLAGEGEVRRDGGVVIQAVTLMIPADNLQRVKRKALQQLVFRKPLVGCIGLVVVDVGGGDEPELGLEAGAVVLEDAVEIEGVAGTLHLEITGWARGVGGGAAGSGGAFGRAFDSLSDQAPGVVEVRGEIDAADAIPAAAEFLVAVDGANTGVLADVARDPGNAVGGAMQVQGIAGGVGFAGLAVVDGEEAEIGSADFAGHADAVLGVHNIARVDQQDGRGEVIGVFEEERTEFGEIDRVALIDGELRLVGFDVAEVGVDGSVKDDAVFENVFGFAAAGALEMPGAPVGIERIEVDQFAFVLHKPVGVQLEIVGSGDAFDAVHGAFLAEHAGSAGGDPGPEVDLAVARQAAHEYDAPVLRRGSEAEAAERNGHQRHPAGRGDAGFRVPDLVVAIVGGGGVIGTGGIGPGGVGLNACRVEFKQDAALTILKRIEDDGDGIVAGHIFAAGVGM